MSSPYRIHQFDVVYGIGIDKVKEIIDLANDYEIIKKWGKVTTFEEIKYDTDEFKALLLDNEELYNNLKSQNYY